jgi:hypothetical protein
LLLVVGLVQVVLDTLVVVAVLAGCLLDLQVLRSVLLTL